jgi:hypothetical protein
MRRSTLWATESAPSVPQDLDGLDLTCCPFRSTGVGLVFPFVLPPSTTRNAAADSEGWFQSEETNRFLQEGTFMNQNSKRGLLLGRGNHKNLAIRLQNAGFEEECTLERFD